MSVTADAYLAGLFEGEGWVGVDRIRQRYPRVRVIIEMTDPEPLRTFMALAGMGSVYGPMTRPSRPEAKPTWKYNLGHKKKVEALWDRMRPWLSVRKNTQFEKALSR